MSGNPNFMEFFKTVCKGVFDSEKKPDRVKELSDLFLVMNNQLIQVNKNRKKNRSVILFIYLIYFILYLYLFIIYYYY